MRNYLGFTALGLILSAGVAAADTTCVRSEQQGCLSFQVVGVEYNRSLMNSVERMSPERQAESLGMDVFEGMLEGKYIASDEQSYYLVLWMDASWGNQPLPADRIVQVCYTGLQGGENVAYVPRGLSLEELGSTTSIQWPDGSVQQAHTALDANCDGGVGAGWVIPYDVAEHIAFAMICADGETHYPFQDGGRQEGIVHSGQEVDWYISNRDEFVLSATVWQ